MLTSSHTAKASSNGTEKDVDTLILGFLTHSMPTAVHQPLIERGTGGYASRKYRDPIGETDTGGRVLQTEASKTQAGNGTDVANAEIAFPAANTYMKKCQYLPRFVGVMVAFRGDVMTKKGFDLPYTGRQVNLFEQGHLRDKVLRLGVGLLPPVCIWVHPWLRVVGF